MAKAGKGNNSNNKTNDNKTDITDGNKHRGAIEIWTYLMISSLDFLRCFIDWQMVRRAMLPHDFPGSFGILRKY